MTLPALRRAAPLTGVAAKQYPPLVCTYALSTCSSDSWRRAQESNKMLLPSAMAMAMFIDTGAVTIQCMTSHPLHCRNYCYYHYY